MSKRGFTLTFVILFFLSAVWMGCSLLRWTAEAPKDVDRRMMDSFECSFENCRDMSPKAQWIAASFHTEYQAVLFDATGKLVAETQEFLLLRDGGPKIFLLPNLTDSERSLLRKLASKDEAEARRRLALASAIDYEGYIYEDTVYPTTLYNIQSSESVQKPLALTENQVLTTDVLAGHLCMDGDGTLTADRWLPYLRETPVETERLMGLLAGAAPVRNFFKWEHFQTTTLGTDTLAVYTVTHPLWDVLSSSFGTLAVWFVCTAIGSAVIALGVDAMLKKRKQ